MTTTADEAQWRIAFHDELVRLKDNVDASARMQFRRAGRLSLWGTALSIATVIATATAGVTTLSKAPLSLWPGWLSLAAAALATFSTAFGAERRASAAMAAGNCYITRRDELRQMRKLDLPSMSITEARERIREITGKIHEINRSAPITGGRRAYKRTQKERAEDDARDSGPNAAT